jgi:hypothetical protein
MFPIIMLDETMTPTHVFIVMTRGEPATSRTSARQDVQVAPTSSARTENRADSLEVLQRVDAEVKTTLPSSLRGPISLGSALTATAPRRRTA